MDTKPNKKGIPWGGIIAAIHILLGVLFCFASAKNTKILDSLIGWLGTPAIWYILLVAPPIALIASIAEEPVHFTDTRLKNSVERALKTKDPTRKDMLKLFSMGLNGDIPAIGYQEDYLFE